MLRLLFFIAILVLTGCRTSPTVRYERFESEAEPLYQAYFFGNAADAFAAMSELCRRMECADRAIWRAMDWGSYAAWTYGRTALAAERAGNIEESQRFRRLAIRAARKRKVWNDAEQKMLPVTPTPTYDELEEKLFDGIRMMDEVIRKDGMLKPEGEPGATDNPDDAQ